MRESYAGGREVVEEHEGHKSYLWVVFVGVGDGRKWGRGGEVLRRPWAQRTAALPAREGGVG